MKNKYPLFLLLFSAVSIFAQPTIDGVFDGEGVWGSPASVADGNAGLYNVNIDKCYVTYDATYAYLCVLFKADGSPANVHKGCFIINTKNGGASNGPWGGVIIFGHSDKPDFALIGRLGDPPGPDGYWAESLIWNGSGWDGYGTNVVGTDMAWTADRDCIEARIERSPLKALDVDEIDFQFYVSDADGDGVFDACPDDEVASGPGIPTTLDNYEMNVPLPVELISFTAQANNNNVWLNWTTATEINNKGFEVQRLKLGDDTKTNQWQNLVFINGKGTTSDITTYEFADNEVLPGVYSYRLKQLNFDGSFEFSKSVEVEVTGFPETYVLKQNYPNPFNPATAIEFAVKNSSFTNLSVYNSLGEKIAVLFNDIAEGGKTVKVNFDASDLSTGIYFYRLTTSEFSEVKKMVLTK